MRVLDKVPHICYLVHFQKDKSKDVLALLDFKSKINTMTPAYTVQLGLKMQKIDVDAQKINRFPLKTYNMIIAVF